MLARPKNRQNFVDDLIFRLLSNLQNSHWRATFCKSGLTQAGARTQGKLTGLRGSVPAAVAFVMQPLVIPARAGVGAGAGHGNSVWQSESES